MDTADEEEEEDGKLCQCEDDREADQGTVEWSSPKAVGWLLEGERIREGPGVVLLCWRTLIDLNSKFIFSVEPLIIIIECRTTTTTTHCCISRTPMKEL